MALPDNWKDVVDGVMQGNLNEALTGKNDPGYQEQVQIRMYQAQQKAQQAKIKVLQGRIDNYKGKTDKASKNALAALNGQLKIAQSIYTAIGQKLTATQNKYYEVTGQYGKLLTGSNRDAFMALDALFKNYGLGSLAGKIYDYVKNGYSSDTISILLQDTKEYKQRFAANDARVKAGLPVLSPADYINTENAYRQLLRQSGLPAGFYDSNSDFTDWIAKDVSPTEIQSRVDLATQATSLANPFYKRALNQIGISDGDMAAYFLDANKALPILQKNAATAQVGAAALQQGLTFDKSYAELLATTGVSAEQAQQGYSEVANQLGTMSALGQIYGEGWTQRESEQAVFQGEAGAAAKQRRLLSQERGAFGGSTGSARGGLGQAGGAR